MRVKLFGDMTHGKASGFYRLSEPQRVLSSAGLDVSMYDQVPDIGWGSIDGEPRVRQVGDFECDVAVFQRPLGRNMADVIELASEQCAIIIDLDDNFHALRPPHPGAVSMNPQHNPVSNWDHLWRATRAADLVTVTTEALAQRYGKGIPTAVLPNYVPARYLSVAGRAHDDLRIGWTGIVETHPRDPQVTSGMAGRVCAETGAKLHIVGDGAGIVDGFGVEEFSLTGWVDFDDYPREMASIDVGMVPLELSGFNESKSWLKGMEFAAFGVPAVLSPTQPNLLLAKRGAGLIARRPRDWHRHLTNLVTDKAMRTEMGARSRAAAASLTYEEHAEKWWSAWAGALARKKIASLL